MERPEVDTVRGALAVERRKRVAADQQVVDSMFVRGAQQALQIVGRRRIQHETHIGVDGGAGLLHTVRGTSGTVADTAERLLFAVGITAHI